MVGNAVVNLEWGHRSIGLSNSKKRTFGRMSQCVLVKFSAPRSRIEPRGVIFCNYTHSVLIQSPVHARNKRGALGSMFFPL